MALPVFFTFDEVDFAQKSNVSEFYFQGWQSNWIEFSHYDAPRSTGALAGPRNTVVFCLSGKTVRQRLYGLFAFTRKKMNIIP